MAYIFYFLGVFPFMYEMTCLVKPRKMRDYYVSIIAKKSDELNKEEIESILLMFGYIVWNFIGLFTSQWPIFLAIFILSLIPKGKFLVIRWLDALITAIMILFIILNKYHFHIDVAHWFMGLF